MRDEYDFSEARRASEIPHLRKLQEESREKRSLTVLLDNDILTILRARAGARGVECQALINELLREALYARPMTEETLRRVLREELGRP